MNAAAIASMLGCAVDRRLAGPKNATNITVRLMDTTVELPTESPDNTSVVAQAWRFQDDRRSREYALLREEELG